jgi:hypothetical protein
LENVRSIAEYVNKWLKKNNISTVWALAGLVPLDKSGER